MYKKILGNWILMIGFRYNIPVYRLRQNLLNRRTQNKWGMCPCAPPHGITTWPSLFSCSLIFKVVHESAPALNSKILSSCTPPFVPPKSNTPDSSGDLAIALSNKG